MLKSIIKFFFPNIQKVVEKEVIVQTLSREAYEKLASRLPNCMVTGSDSDTVAAHKLGVQLALAEIRKGLVV